MPETDHLANAINGNIIKKVATTTTTPSGRISTLPIYTINLAGAQNPFFLINTAA